MKALHVLLFALFALTQAACVSLSAKDQVRVDALIFESMT